MLTFELRGAFVDAGGAELPHPAVALARAADAARSAHKQRTRVYDRYLKSMRTD